MPVALQAGSTQLIHAKHVHASDLQPKNAQCARSTLLTGEQAADDGGRRAGGEGMPGGRAGGVHGAAPNWCEAADPLGRLGRSGKAWVGGGAVKFTHCCTWAGGPLPYK